MPGTWQPLVSQPNFRISTMILLTDGRIMVQEEATPHWHALSPDATGSYVNGAWSVLSDMSTWRRYYASGVLKDGRVIICGGEQNGTGVEDTNRCEIYDPVADAWSIIPSPPGWKIIGDAACCVLPDGRFMIGALLSGQCMIYNPVSNSWSPAANKVIRSNEETWILLPDDTIITPQCFKPFESEKYVISANLWKNEGKPPVQLVDPVMAEIGPGMLLYNGKVIYFGAANVHGHGKTALYTPPSTPTGTGTWVAGPDIPAPATHEAPIVSNDCPAALMPNGVVLFTAAPFRNNDWGSPVFLFEYDPPSNTIALAPLPPNNNAQLYWSRMMLLPTGQVLFSPSSNNVQCYTPQGGPQEAWRPTIAAVLPTAATNIFLLKGTQLNGLSQANIYGDDCYPATNYPLVRLRDSNSGTVYYARTFNFSTMGVATGASLQSAMFSTEGIPCGQYDLEVVANGIASHAVVFCSCPPPPKTCRCHGDEDPCQQQPCCIHDEQQVAIPAEVTTLKRQVRGLQNALNRLSKLIPADESPLQPKEKKGSAAEGAKGDPVNDEDESNAALSKKARKN